MGTCVRYLSETIIVWIRGYLTFFQGVGCANPFLLESFLCLLRSRLRLLALPQRTSYQPVRELLRRSFRLHDTPHVRRRWQQPPSIESMLSPFLYSLVKKVSIDKPKKSAICSKRDALMSGPIKRVTEPLSLTPRYDKSAFGDRFLSFNSLLIIFPLYIVYE